MFLPSLPIILPFNSSEGNATTEIVLSHVTSCEYLEIAKDKIFLAASSAVDLASSSWFLMYAATS